MILYILKRLIIGFFVLIAMSALTFWLMHATPGQFFDALKMNPQISPETIARYETMYHLKDPWHIQYWHWLTNALHGEFGYSFYYNIPATNLIVARMANTLLLSLASLVVTWLIGIPLGVWAAMRHNTGLDKSMGFLAYIAFCVPSFFLAIVLLFLASHWGVLPLGGIVSAVHDDLSWPQQILDYASHLVIPTIVLSLASIAGLQRIMRANMLKEMGQMYMTAGRAKGLSEGRLLYDHALKNAFNPMVTLLGYEFSALLSGAALVEIICSWPGLGALMLTAVRAKDVYVVMASMVMGGVLLLIGNLCADIALTCLDPRIRYDRQR